MLIQGILCPLPVLVGTRTCVAYTQRDTDISFFFFFKMKVPLLKDNAGHKNTYDYNRQHQSQGFLWRRIQTYFPLGST